MLSILILVLKILAKNIQLTENNKIISLNYILTTFKFILITQGDNSQNLSANIVLYIDNSAFSLKNSLYVKFNQPRNIKPFNNYLFIITPNNIVPNKSVTSVLTIFSNIGNGISVDDSLGTDAFILKIDKTVDITKLTLLISKAGIIIRQESKLETNSNISTTFYSDIFNKEVNYEQNIEKCVLFPEYITYGNVESSIATLYRTFQNITFYRGVSEVRLRKIRSAIIYNEFIKDIRNRVGIKRRAKIDIKMIEEYTKFIKAVLKSIAYSYENNKIPEILKYKSRYIQNRKDAIFNIILLSYKKYSLIDRTVENAIENLSIF